MNNACPSCGAVYAVTVKDIGRKIKCKKCSTALRVDDSGLVEDVPPASKPPKTSGSASHVAAAVVEDDLGDEDAPVVTKSKKARQYTREGGGDGFLKKIGGIPTILFSLGLLLVLWFSFQAGPIAEAALVRSAMAPKKVQMEMASEMEGTKGDADKVKKIMESYEKKQKEASKEAGEAVIDTFRGVKWDRYGQLFGFIILAFGCIGYLRSEQLPIMHYTAAVVLAGMLLAVFGQATGCGGGHNDLMSTLGKQMGGGGGKGGGGLLD